MPVPEYLAQVFSCKFWKIFKNTLFTEHLWATASDWLILAQYFLQDWNFPNFIVKSS